MKNIYLVLTVALLSLVLISCSKTDDSVTSGISVSSNSVGIKKAQTRTSIELTCSSTWNAYIQGSCSWASISPQYGTGNGTISISSTVNNTGAKRHCTITINSGTSTQTVEVVQTYY